MNANYIIWYLNGTDQMNKVSEFQLKYSEHVSENVQPTVSNLTINITEVAGDLLNNTVVYCVGLNYSTDVISTAVLLTQGEFVKLAW